MPEITLREPSNSRFHSSLNEIDLAIKEVLLHTMRDADPRNKSGLQDSIVENEDDYLWDRTRIFQVDDLTTEDIFDTYLLRKRINGLKDTDISFPLIGYKQNDVDTVFWGTGNRYKEWYFDIPAEPASWEVGDEVLITAPFKYRGLRANIEEVVKNGNGLFCKLSINGDIVFDDSQRIRTPLLFNVEDLRGVGDKAPTKFKAKAITCTYDVALLCDNRDEIQYIRDKFFLRCLDAHIWWTYKSPTLNGAYNQIFTVFEIPNIDRYPASKEKLHGPGYIYGSGFKINVWGCVTDTPIPASIIETIRMNIHVENHDKVSKIVIN